MVTRTEYLQLISKHKFILESLEHIVRGTNSTFEGNCFYRHTTFEPMEELINKQINIVNVAQHANNIVEIGFNAGHSCLLMLLSNPNCNIVAVDICQHPYTKKCFQYLNLMFPGRLSLIEGISYTVMCQEFNSEPFDLIHIDGAHDIRTANLDFYTSTKKGKNGTVVIFGDTQIPHLQMLWDGYIRDGLIVEKTDILPATHAIGVLRV